MQPVLDLPPDEPCNLDAMTRHLLVMALEKTRGHKGQAADLLGVHPRTFTRMMRRFAIPEDSAESRSVMRQGDDAPASRRLQAL